MVVVVSDFSSGFDTPNVKLPLEELSVLDDPVPNTVPLPAPNLNPEPVAGGSDFFSSLEAAPNLNPSDELPNLNPDEAVVSSEVVLDANVPNGTANLNPPDEEEDSENDPPNLKPPDPDPELLSDVPNLKPPVLEADEPNVEDDIPPADEPNDVPKALGSTFTPGLAALQATQTTSSALFCTRQTSQSHAPSGFLNLSPKPTTEAVLAEEEDPVQDPAEAPADVPGLALVQATHCVSSALFCTIHVSHSHAPSGFLNLSPNPKPVGTGAVEVGTVLTAEKAEGIVNEDLSPVPGLAVSQATHFTASGLFITRHVSQSQVPAGFENIVP